MSDATNQNSTVITRISAAKPESAPATMSYTAVTTHPDMALSFTGQLLRFAGQLIPDRRLSIEDIITVCRTALTHTEQHMLILEGRQLRGRISEQLSRARRYGEPFSLIVLKLAGDISGDVHESLVDTLCERMRQTDILFTFKKRIVLMLPHTEEHASIILTTRVKDLLAANLPAGCLESIERLSFPCTTITKASQVLDWAEDQLR
jgi:hypothetical protein